MTIITILFVLFSLIVLIRAIRLTRIMCWIFGKKKVMTYYSRHLEWLKRNINVLDEDVIKCQIKDIEKLIEEIEKY
jgi:hypothetical protein